MLELSHVSKSYKSIPAVRDVSFVLREGEVLGYLGPNGSGKSTTVKMVIGLIKPTKGHVLFDGRKIYDDLPGYRAQLGYVPEEAQVYTHLSGLEYLQLVGRLRGSVLLLGPLLAAITVVARSGTAMSSATSSPVRTSSSEIPDSSTMSISFLMPS